MFAAVFEHKIRSSWKILLKHVVLGCRLQRAARQDDLVTAIEESFHCISGVETNVLYRHRLIISRDQELPVIGMKCQHPNELSNLVEDAPRA